MMMKVAINASSILSGNATYKILKGNTPIFPTTVHIKTNPVNHERKVACNKLNFLEIIKIAIAKNKDHNPHIAPLTGSDGNTNPILS
jgi:hypothetical protein